MRRIIMTRRSKKSMTLVELVIAMTLTAFFAIACVMLILPIEKIYTRTTDVSRAQFIADTIVDSLRAECASTYIESDGDVWIGDFNNEELLATKAGSSILFIRKNKEYCEAIFANNAVPTKAYIDLSGIDTNSVTGVTSKAIFRLFPDGITDPEKIPEDIGEGYVHFGYYKLKSGETNVTPESYYDFTNPFPYATYREYNVSLTFSGIGKKSVTSGSVEKTYPAYVNCKIDVWKDSEDNIVYSRETVLCFAGPVQ